MSFIAGGYTVTYDGNSVGQLFEGVTFTNVAHMEVIIGDNIARAAQDVVFQGIDVTSDFALMEWDVAAAINMYWPFGTAWLNAGVVGRVAKQQSLAKQIVMTAIAGTPAATQPATLTLPNSLLHEGFPVQHIFRPAHRRVPLRMRHFPDIQQDYTSIYGTTT